MNDTLGIRTLDPEEADYFYVPVFGACYVYKDFELFDRYRFLIKQTLNHIINTYPYWKRTRGRDHIFSLVHDFGACLSWLDNTDHVFYDELRNSIIISHLGDLSMGCFSTRKDIVVPPYIYETEIRNSVTSHNQYNRSTFAHFRGTIEWYHHNAIPGLYIPKGASKLYSRGVRQFLLREFKEDDEVKFFVGGSDTYIQEVKESIFCLCPRGFAPWSRRLYDSILLGCIPVIIADYIELPFEDMIDYRKFTVKIAGVIVFLYFRL